MEMQIAPSSRPVLCILGGTGFVGQHLISQLSHDNYTVRVLTRRRERYRNILVLPHVDVIEADVHDPSILEQNFIDCDAVINLIAILNEKRRGDFEYIHEKLPGKIVQACVDTGVKRLLHVSALQADREQARSRYLMSKGKGENIVYQQGQVGVTSFRPSVIFGPSDQFFNRFASLLKLIPLPIPLACPDARFAPVYVGDVVSAMVSALKNPKTIGQRYNLCGPHAYTLEQLLQYTASCLGIRRKIIRLGRRLSAIQACTMGALPGKLMTYDNYLSMQIDNVCQGNFPEIFNIEPQSMDSIVPHYLANQSHAAQFHRFRFWSRHHY